MSCGIGHRHVLDPMSLQLCLLLQLQLAWEPPYVTGVSLKRQKKKKKKKKLKLSVLYLLESSHFCCNLVILLIYLIK